MWKIKLKLMQKITVFLYFHAVVFVIRLPHGWYMKMKRSFRRSRDFICNERTPNLLGFDKKQTTKTDIQIVSEGEHQIFHCLAKKHTNTKQNEQAELKTESKTDKN